MLVKRREGEEVCVNGTNCALPVTFYLDGGEGDGVCGDDGGDRKDNIHSTHIHFGLC